MEVLPVPESAFEKNRQLALLRVLHEEMNAEGLVDTQTYKLLTASIEILKEEGGYL